MPIAPFRQLAVAWDNGSTLMMILDEGNDQVRLIEPTPQPTPQFRPSPTAPPPGPPQTARPRRADPAHPATSPGPPAPRDSGAHSGPHGRTSRTGPGVQHPTRLVLPAGLAARPVCPRRALPIPFVNTPGPDGLTDFTSIDPARVAEAGRARVCGLCSRPNGYWLAFLGGPKAANSRAYSDPPMHPVISTLQP